MAGQAPQAFRICPVHTWPGAAESARVMFTRLTGWQSTDARCPGAHGGEITLNGKGEEVEW